MSSLNFLLEEIKKKTLPIDEFRETGISEHSSVTSRSIHYENLLKYLKDDSISRVVVIPNS